MQNFFQMLINAINLGFIFAMLGIGLSLIFGVVEIVNFAHGECMMFSMYIAYWLYAILKLDPVLSTPICALISFAFGVLVHKILIKPILKAEMLTQIIATFGLALFMSSLAQFLWTPNFRSIPKTVLNLKINFLGISLQAAQGIIIAFSIIILSILFWIINKTEFGRGILAVSEDKETASLMGINPDVAFMVTWGIGLACVGITGALLSGVYYIYPLVGSSFGLLSFIAVAMGGFGSIPGAFIGAFLVGFVQVFSAYFIPPSLKLLVVFVLFIGVLMVKPQGFWGRY